ncbi:NAD(P)H-dependent glycerol-3-phosphate dehydrogenase [Proteinivorax hydrogeniformans]|uniref:Glycerol-3-phosphate dehydrogenase [NAD(P)+] n=1 Tax=Proteinivorax hydrogeniformans TaxID=1826727 RepID=A0AAU8HWR7_9FIRM
MKKVSVLGAGGWGTAIAISLAKDGQQVKLWTRTDKSAQNLNKTRENIKYLPGAVIPANVTISSSIEKSVLNSDIIVIVTPSSAVRRVCEKIKPVISKDTIIVTASKGFEQNTLLRMSEVIQDVLGKQQPVAVLSGPNHAEEVGREIPTATVVASSKRKTAEIVQDAFMGPKLRVYTNPDIVGVETGGALKNIIALGAGISDGLGFGDNTKSALLTRGLTEIARLGVAMGGETVTFAGLSGIGDLVATCTSTHSRNWRAGNLLGQGKTLDEILADTNMVVEGVKTARSVNHLAEKYNVEMPISKQIYKVLFEDKDPKEAVTDLMLRGKTNEMEEVVITQNAKW